MILPLSLAIAMLFVQTAAGYRLREPRGYDFRFHLSSWMEVAQQWQQGIVFPRWAQWAYYGFGEPRFIFYPPLLPMLGAALGTLLPWNLVPQAFVCLVLAGAWLSMFRLAREFLSPEESAWAALLYAFNPYAMLMVYARSSLSEALASVFLPLLVLYAIRIDDSRTERAIVRLAVVFAACWLTNAPTGVISAYSLALLLLVLGLWRRSARIPALGLASIALGFLMAGFYVVPAAFETRWVTIREILTPLLRPENNFLFSRSPLRKGGFNLVVSLAAAGEFAVLGAVVVLSTRAERRKPTVRRVLLVLAGACALFMFPVTAFAWAWLPKLRFVQFPWRLLALLNVPLAYLVAAVPIVRRGWKIALLLVVTAGWSLVGALSLRMPIWPPGVIEEVRADLREGRGWYQRNTEYLPVGCRSDRLPQDLSRATLTNGVTGKVDVERWNAEKRSMRVRASAAATLVLRLFHYPAWKASLDGEPVAVESWGPDGFLAIRVPAGESQVEVTFGRTPDRTLGALITFFGVAVATGLLVLDLSRNVFGSRPG